MTQHDLFSEPIRVAQGPVGLSVYRAIIAPQGVVAEWADHLEQVDAQMRDYWTRYFAHCDHASKRAAHLLWRDTMQALREALTIPFGDTSYAMDMLRAEDKIGFRFEMGHFSHHQAISTHLGVLLLSLAAFTQTHFQDNRYSPSLRDFIGPGVGLLAAPPKPKPAHQEESTLCQPPPRPKTSLAPPTARPSRRRG